MMKRISSGCGVGIMFLAAMLILPRLALAITEQLAQSIGEPKGLIEAKLMGHLWSHTQDTKRQGDANYLKAALGEQPFSAHIEKSGEDKKGQFYDVTTTGIEDTTSAYIRAESAQIIAEFAEEKDKDMLLAKLFSKAQVETDPLARETIYLAYYQLGFKYTPEAQKKQFILDFLETCAEPAVFQDDRIKSLPRDSFTYIIGEAQDRGIQQAIEPLKTLSATIFKDDEFMQAQLDSAIEIITLHRQYKGQALYEQALSHKNRDIQYWALAALTKEDSPEAQRDANIILINLLAAKKGNCFILKKLMDEKMFLRSETQNPSLEFGAGLPLGWRISKGNPASRVIYPSPEASSGKRGIEINNLAGGTTSLVSFPQTYFKARLPKEVEYGLAYKMAYPENGTALIGEDGLSLLTEAGEEQPFGKSSLILKLVINGKEMHQVSENAPYNFNWTQLYARYASQEPINSAYLVVTIFGKARFYLDDLFVRRSEEEFNYSAPEIKPLTSSAQAILAGEFVHLKADVTDADGDKVTGHWFSSREGDLGEGLDITARLSQPSKDKWPSAEPNAVEKEPHTLVFTAKDEFGLENLSATELYVLEPSLALAASQPSTFLSPISGNLNFKLKIEGLAQFSSQYSLGNAYLYVNDVSAGIISAFPYNLDTTYLPQGPVKLQVKAELQKGRRRSRRLYSSNVFYFYLANSSCKAPRIIAPLANAQLFQTSEAKVKFANLAANPVTSLGYYLVNEQNQAYFLGFCQQAPDYKLSFNLRGFAKGVYKLYALAYYRQPNAKYKVAPSEPINVAIKR
jgi:hypothetical protein